MKQIIAGSLITALSISAVHDTMSVIGDKEMVEGGAGLIQVYPDGREISPVFEYISGASFQVTVDPERPFIGFITPNGVSEDTKSTVRISVGSEVVNHTFMVKNATDPEQAEGKTIALCTFYNDYKGHTGIAGTGAFSFDKRTVDNVKIGDQWYGDHT